MSYFSMFPDILYDAKGNGKDTFMKDIFRRVKVKSNAKGNIVEFDYYDVQDGETPEIIAFKYYGDAELHWTILVVNDIIDYYTDWPMSVQRFEQYMNDKYENLGLCKDGEAGKMIDEGHVELGGKVPVNVSGGLLSKGHPLGATGIANIYEVCTHLRGEAGERQVEGARLGMTHVIGLGTACGIHILEKV